MRSATTRPRRSPSRPRSPVTSCSRPCTPTTRPSAITRLTEMGIEPFLVGSAVDAVLAQRLARRLCSKCKEPFEPTEEQLVKMGYRPYPGDPEPTFFKPVGCSNCAKTGYKGRLALHEVMAMTDPIERLTVERESATKIMQVAIERGHAHAARGRPAQGEHGRHLARRDLPRRRLRVAAAASASRGSSGRVSRADATREDAREDSGAEREEPSWRPRRTPECPRRRPTRQRRRTRHRTARTGLRPRRPVRAAVRTPGDRGADGLRGARRRGGGSRDLPGRAQRPAPEAPAYEPPAGYPAPGPARAHRHARGVPARGAPELVADTRAGPGRGRRPSPPPARW